MLQRFRPWLPDHHGALSSLYLTESLRSFGLALLGIFTPIYIFELTHNFYILALFYLVISLAAVFSLVPFASLISRIGVVRSVLLSDLICLGHLGLLLAAPLCPPLIYGAAVLAGLLVPTYWVPYHFIYTKEGRIGRLGREIGLMGLLVRAVGAVAPLLGGLVVTFWGFPVLYALGMGVILLSSLPLFFARDEEHLAMTERVSGRRIIHDLFSSGWKPLLWGYGGYGVDAAVGDLFWPLFLFTVGAGSFVALGSVSSAPAVTGIVATALIAVLIDRIGYRRALRWGVLFWAASWLVTGFLRSIPALLVLAIFDGIYVSLFSIPPEIVTYTLAKREPLGFLVKREMSIHLFRLAGILLGVLLWFFFPQNWPVLFAPAVLGSLLAVALTRAR